ncbi:hypothetical protein PTTG_10474 [Puccinia triticina 1-1 BBBD Race 1]|uniref:Uncharacterized protein n=1 Tax=Puccinia triticina (isolate 1-1 / race 1 (BBBD)) TaxID=630390 RepID=A0A180FZ50_PUCT1|nr:hypothetical protein PTTG_10474 [Puccinia triticina 1-1 BBBD Race 1]
MGPAERSSQGPFLAQPDCLQSATSPPSNLAPINPPATSTGSPDPFTNPFLPIVLTDPPCPPRHSVSPGDAPCPAATLHCPADDPTAHQMLLRLLSRANDPLLSPTTSWPPGQPPYPPKAPWTHRRLHCLADELLDPPMASRTRRWIPGPADGFLDPPMASRTRQWLP